jgi:hypothetical protein
MGWAEVTSVNATRVVLRDGGEVKLSVVTAYLVAYPGGTLVDRRGADHLAPPVWVGGLSPATLPERDELSVADLKEGQSLVHVSFGRSTAEPRSRHHYSTTLTNASGRRVRVLKFAGYTKSGSGNTYVLNTVSRRFFTAEDFAEWYDQAGDWIVPGQWVTDPNNYGSPPALWAYYCEDETGRKFVTGGIVE